MLDGPRLAAALYTALMGNVIQMGLELSKVFFPDFKAFYEDSLSTEWKALYKD